MSGFVTKTTATTGSAPDPTKRVNYTYGMVLGVDDFVQESAYQLGRVQWLARSLGGYGTVWGLQVIVEDDGANGPRVSVRPGAALSPQGQMICVPTEQCASLNAWLARQDPIRVAGNSVELYVTLCYDSCLTDNVPIPGEPCRSEDDAMAASRVQDDFRLELRFQPPAQFEEAGLRDFVRWLREVPLAPPGSGSDQPAFLDALREALQVEAGATPSGFAFGSLPPGLAIPTDQAADFWRAAFRVWTTELRPQQLGQGQFVRFVRQALQERAGDPASSVDQFREALRSAAHLSDATVSPGYLDKAPMASVVMPQVPAEQAVYWQAAFEVWRQEVLPRWISKGGQCAAAPDEACVLLAELTVPLTDNQHVDGDASAVAVNEDERPYLLHQRMLHEWALRNGDGPTILGGDVSGPVDQTKIVRLQGNEVDAESPTNRQVLSFNGTTKKWGPQGLPVPTLSGDVEGPIQTTMVTALRSVPIAKDQPDNGQVLTYDESQKAWAPATPKSQPAGDYVIHGEGLPTYAIAAAGIVRADGTSDGPVYNGLSCKAIDNGLILLSFGALDSRLGYRPPYDETFQYIVKVLPVSKSAPIAQVAHQYYSDDGIVLLVTLANEPIEQRALSEMSFMVEISYFEAK
jgi:hypothetical protein